MTFSRIVSLGGLIAAQVLGCIASGQTPGGTSPITELYPAVSSGVFTGPAVAASPDPLVAFRWPAPKASDGLQVYLQKPQTVTADVPASFGNLQSLTTDSPFVTVQGPGSIFMDFGRESAAWLEIDSPDLTGDVTMSISEYNQPEITQFGGANSVKTLKPVKYGNTYRLELNNLLYEGVRFGWVHVNSFTSQWHINGVRLVCQTKPANYNGSFSCSDPTLTKIWYTAAYSVKLNLLADEFGSILIDRGDRGSFTGDSHPSQAASLVAFGNWDFVKQNIDRTSNANQGIIGYDLYWILSLIDYYSYTGDTAAIAQYLTNAQGKLDFAYNVYGTNPSLVFYGWDERTGGFEYPSCPESQRAYKMLSIRAWKEFAATMAIYGRPDLQQKYEGYAAEKLAALRTDPEWYEDFQLHSGADAINTGLLTASEKSEIFTREMSDRVNRLSLSPFNQFFILQAFARLNKYDDALNTMDDVWGGQLRYGATTFFEVYRPSWNLQLGMNDPIPNAQCGYTSLCHPWAAGPVKWLSEEVLGIKPTAPGFATYQIVPHLGSNLTQVSGETPGPLGVIQASFDVTTGACSFSAPQGSVGKVGIPKVGKAITGVTINGTLAWNGTSYQQVSGVAAASEDAEFVYFTGVQPGSYAVQVSYQGATPAYQPPAEEYRASFVKEDATTSGSWGGVYGKDGYILCNYGTAQATSLPAYVTSVDFYLTGGNGLPLPGVWVNGTSDARALAPDATNSFPRNATAINTAMQQGTRNTMTFTVNSNGVRDYQVALYFVDWDNTNRRTAVEMFDADTLDMVAPVRMVTDFHGGKYLVYSYNKSAKFRIDQVRGDNAVLSGVFFDSSSSSPIINSDSQPASATDVVGGEVTFSAGVNSTLPSTYQWQKIVDGVVTDIAGATGQSLTLSNVQLVDAGYYQLRATNAAGVSYSTPAPLTVTLPPAAVGNVVTTFAAQTGTGGTGNNFSPTWVVPPGSLIAGKVPSAVGSGNFVSSTNVLTDGSTGRLTGGAGAASVTQVTCGSGAGQSVTYNLGTAAGGYNLSSIAVYGGWCDAGRDQQAYTVYYSTASAPTTFIQLAGVSYNPADSANTQSATRAVLRSVNNAPLAGNVAALKFDFTTPAPENGYCGYSEIAVYGAPAAPVVTMNTSPATAVDVIGGQVTFSASISGAGPLSYQWQKVVSGVAADIAGATGQTLTLANLQPADAASYQLKATNANGTAISAAGKLTVNAAPAAVNNVVTSMAAQTGLGGNTTFVPGWSFVTAGNLVSGALPSSSAGNFSLNTNNATPKSLTAGGSLAVVSPLANDCGPNYVSCGNGSGAGSSVIYTLPDSASGYALTGITVHGGWRDSGRDQQAYTVSYSTTAAPKTFTTLGAVNYNPANPSSVQSATRATLTAASGVLATNVAAVKFDFTTPATENGWAGYSQIAIYGVPVLSPPANLAAVAGDAQAGLTWTAVPGASGYNVKRATVSSGPYTTVGNVPTATFLNTGLSNGTTYFYVVTALNAAGETAASSQISVTPASSAYASWLAAYPSLTGGDRAPDADPDHDGVPNAIEFLTGTSPVDASSRASISTAADSAGNVALHFRRADAAKSYVVTVETSADLSSAWTSLTIPNVATAGPPVTVVENGDAADDITVVISSAGITRRFARVSITIPALP